MKIVTDFTGRYNSSINAWCVFRIAVARWQLGLQCRHYGWMQVDVKILRKSYVGNGRPLFQLCLFGTP